ncbi:hypothetical protein CAPTEDRAFT_208622, partial [Capitella teleta]
MKKVQARNYYYQVQLGMALMDIDVAHLYVWTPTDHGLVVIERQPRADELAMLTTLFDFHTRPTQAMEARMTEWAAEANADMEFALISGVGGYSDRFVLCLKKAGPGQITLSRGCETVRARIWTTALPTRLTFGRPFLERLLSKVVQHESRVPEQVWTKGGAFTAAAIRRILSVNSRLLDRENRFEDLVEAGDMTLLDIPTVNHAREIVARDKDELAFASRPELNGKLRLTFRLYDRDGRPAAPDDALPKDGGPTTVEIEGQPGAVGVKRKHWWIYSKVGNFGKTHTMTTELVNKYKAIFMNDANNAMCLPKTAQFIVLDE